MGTCKSIHIWALRVRLVSVSRKTRIPQLSNCIDQDFPCQDPDYSDFDNTAKAELRNPPSASQIVNESQFCTLVPIDETTQLGDLTHKDYLKGLRGKTGLYHLWIDYDRCDDHQTHTMHCVYIGKGFAEGRINSHIKDKWPKQEQLYPIQLYVSFYECSNRISKYLEQLFLDTYSFCLNSNENCGTKSLFAVWDDDRHFFGTELHAVSSLSKITSLDNL